MKYCNDCFECLMTKQFKLGVWELKCVLNDNKVLSVTKECTKFPVPEDCPLKEK